MQAAKATDAAAAPEAERGQEGTCDQEHDPAAKVGA